MVNAKELSSVRYVRGLLASQKWRAAYDAVDELRWIRARALEGDQAQFNRLPATVTNILDHARNLP